MAEFMMNSGLVEGSIRELEEITKSLNAAAEGILSVQNRLVVKEVGTSLRAISEEVASSGQQMEVMKNSLENIVGQYRQSEMRILMLQAVKDGNADGSQNNGEQEWYQNLDKLLVEVLLSIIAEAGDMGKESTLLIEILKATINDGDVEWKDNINIIKGLLESIAQIVNDDGNMPLQEFLGLDKLKTIVTDSAAKWFDNGSETFKKTFVDRAGIRNEGGAIDSLKTAGWFFTAMSNLISNASEYKSGEISIERFAIETVSETVIDVAKDAALAAGVAAVAAVAGIAMPVIAVGGIAVATSIVADRVCENITGKDLTEYISDGVLDFVSDAARKITSATAISEKVSCGWSNLIYDN